MFYTLLFKRWDLGFFKPHLKLLKCLLMCIVNSKPSKKGKHKYVCIQTHKATIAKFPFVWEQYFSSHQSPPSTSSAFYSWIRNKLFLHKIYRSVQTEVLKCLMPAGSNMLHTCSGNAIFLVHLHSHFALHASAPEFQAKAVGHRSEQGMMARERSNAALHTGQVRL